jgi:hypothetical protein
MTCFGPAADDHFQLCFMTLPPLVEGTFSADEVINVDECPTLVPEPGGGSSMWCVIAAPQITIGPNITVRATQSGSPWPLVLLATSGDLTIHGTLDVASHQGQGPNLVGAGADPASCMPHNGTMGGGGAGGSFVSSGGAGGTSGGTPQGPATASTLRGGCPGGSAGPNGSQVGGQGGGAVYLVAKNAITIDGLVDASGAGGTRGLGSASLASGGGGGGSGGMIALAAEGAITVTANGALIADGGGGGGGGVLGAPGGDGHEWTSTLAPLGGSPGVPGSMNVGGNGAYLNMAASDGSTGLTTAGGGGGGTGAIRALTSLPVSKGRIDPAPTL